MKHIKLLPYILIHILLFYILPLIMINTGISMLILLFVMPISCFITAIFFGAKYSFNWMYSLAVALLFITTIFIYYNSSAVVYTFIYGAIALVGNLIGMSLYKKSSK